MPTKKIDLENVLKPEMAEKIAADAALTFDERREYKLRRCRDVAEFARFTDSFYFTKDTMRFFRSRVANGGALIGRRFAVLTQKRGFRDERREALVVLCGADGHVSTVTALGLGLSVPQAVKIAHALADRFPLAQQ